MDRHDEHLTCDRCDGGADWLRVCDGCHELLSRGRGLWVCTRCSGFSQSVSIAVMPSGPREEGTCRRVAVIGADLAGHGCRFDPQR